MSARGALINPALFGGADVTPPSCVTDYLQLALVTAAFTVKHRLTAGRFVQEYGGQFAIHQHHISNMLTPLVTKAERSAFNNLRSLAAACDFLAERGLWPPNHASWRPHAWFTTPISHTLS